MALSFKINQGSNCDKIQFRNCSEYCNPITYSIDNLLAVLTSVLGINEAGGVYQFEGTGITSGELDSYEWTFGATTISSSIAVFTLTLDAINTVTFTVTDDNGLTSTLTFKIKLNATGEIVWLAAPGLDITTYANAAGPANNVYFLDNSYLLTTAIDASTDVLNFGDATTATTFPQLKDYGTSSVTRSATYTYDEDTDAEEVSLAFQIKISSTSASCTDELTEDNITEVLLIITNPDGESDTLDITDSFFDNEFYLDAATFGEDGSDEFDSIDFSTPGIYQFRVTATKVDGTTHVFSTCIKVVIICSIRCAFDSLLYEMAIEDDCTDCTKDKIEQALEMNLYIKALENAIACADTNQINNLIDILVALADDVRCDC